MKARRLVRREVRRQGRREARRQGRREARRQGIYILLYNKNFSGIVREKMRIFVLSVMQIFTFSRNCEKRENCLKISFQRVKFIYSCSSAWYITFFSLPNFFKTTYPTVFSVRYNYNCTYSVRYNYQCMYNVYIV